MSAYGYCLVRAGFDKKEECKEYTKWFLRLCCISFDNFLKRIAKWVEYSFKLHLSCLLGLFLIGFAVCHCHKYVENLLEQVQH